MYGNTKDPKYLRQLEERTELEESSSLISDYFRLQTDSRLILDYKATVIKTAWYWHKNRQINQWNTIDSREINSHTFDQLVLNKGGKNIYNGENTVFSVSGAGKIEQLYVKD